MNAYKHYLKTPIEENTPIFQIIREKGFQRCEALFYFVDILESCEVYNE